jgi:hypothetical protein
VGQESQTVQDGVYTEEQASEGMKVYEEACLICHPIEEYVGIYLEGWVGMPVSMLIDSIAETMPLDNPGALDEQQFVDMFTYILQANGLPAGDAALSKKSAESIIIEGPFGEAGGDSDSDSNDGAKPQ